MLHNLDIENLCNDFTTKNIISNIDIYTKSKIDKSNNLILDISSEMISKLKNHITRSVIDHGKMILQENSLMNAHIYCVINNISSQKYGTFLENYILSKYQFVKNNAYKCNGDCLKNDKNIEIKVSLGGFNHKKFNYVQIRISHNIQYYILTAYYLTNKNVSDGGELFIFKISKNDMQTLILNYGGYAHGTNKINGPITIDDLKNDKNIKEYALRPSYGNKCWNHILQYRINEMDL